MARLIINADDFGLSSGINKGILAAHEFGIVTSTTVMMNMPFAREAPEAKRQYPKLGFGIHLVATSGFPLGGYYSTLTKTDGSFKKDLLKNSDFDKDEVFKEWNLQAESFFDLGLSPSHFDSHLHIHQHKILYSVLKRLQDRYKIPFRNKFSYFNRKILTKSRFENSFYKNGVTIENLLKIIHNIKKNDIVEIGCHPGFVDDSTNINSGYFMKREDEVRLLCNEKVINEIIEKGITLNNYDELLGISYTNNIIKYILERAKIFINR